MSINRTDTNYDDLLFPRQPGPNRNPVQNLGKDEFLQLFITQLVHQNPMEPLTNDQFIAQMAQFTAIEQATNTASTVAEMLIAQHETNDLLSVMVMHQMGSISRLLYESSALIGRTVVIRSPDEALPVMGVVVSVAMNEGAVEVELDNGRSYSIADITNISK